MANKFNSDETCFDVDILGLRESDSVHPGSELQSLISSVVKSANKLGSI